MGLKFIIAAAPRSATAWAANWLSTEKVHCIHDPLWDYFYDDLNTIEIPGKEVGIACTGMGFFSDWVNLQPCPKVILHRPRDEIAMSTAAIGLPAPHPRMYAGLWQIQGMHVAWTEL